MPRKQSKIPRTVKTVGPVHEMQRASFKAGVIHHRQTPVSYLEVSWPTGDGEDHLELQLCFTDVCNLRTLLEDLQAAHADAMTALEADDLGDM